MKRIIEGKVYVLGDNIDTDQIIPAQHLVYRLSDPEERKLYGKYALSGAPIEHAGLPDGGKPFVAEGKTTSDYAIIVGGRNFGCGSSREHAPFALREAGVQAVIAESYARIFFRNCINVGLPVIECDTSQIDEGDELDVDLERGIVLNRTKGIEIKAVPLPPVMVKILNDGGLAEHFKRYGGFNLD
mgnify:CR=1 FL=1